MQHIICEVTLAKPVNGQTLINITRELAPDPHVEVLDDGYKLLGSRSQNGFYGFKLLVDGQKDKVSADYWYTRIVLVHWNWPGDHEFREHLVPQKTAYLNELGKKFEKKLT